MEDDYDEYRRWDGDVDVEVCFVFKFKTIFYSFEIIYYNIFFRYLNIFIQADDNDDILENPQETLTQCLEKFSSADYIMEPGIFSQLKR